MKIAIVENEWIYTQNLQSLLKQWSEEKQTTLDVSCFENGASFLNATQKEFFHLVFMDIQMEEMDGLTCAKKLREMGFNGSIVFLTAFSEYVFEGYHVQALNYLLKPVSYAKISACLNYKYQELYDEHYIFRNGNDIIQIPYSKIICFSSANHYTEIITPDATYQQLEPIKGILSRLPARFHSCHRTAIINEEHVSMIRGHEVVLSNGMVIPISRTYLSTIRTMFLNYADRMR